MCSVNLAGFRWSRVKMFCALHAKRDWHCACMWMNSATAAVGLWRANLGVETADHAYHTPLEVREAMKVRNVNTGFLPGTPYAMGDQWPDMHQVVESDIPFTLATDFNPNCRTLSLPFMCSLMVQRCGMHPLDALAAVSFVRENHASSVPSTSWRR